MPGWIRPAWFVLATLAVASSACRPYVEGNCVGASDARTLARTFEGIRVENAIRATVTAGVAQPKVVVSGDEPPPLHPRRHRPRLLQNFGSDACTAVVPQAGATVFCPVP